MTTFLDLARNRYSCRNYDSRPVGEKELESVLEAGRVAPSAVNFQPWHFFVIRGEQALQNFHAAYHREWFRTAPCVIVICADHERAWKRKSDGADHALVDAAITTDHMTLQATALGLATCWVCNFDPAETRRLLDLPVNMEPVVILPLGYPLDEADPDRHEAGRRPLSEIVTFIGE